MYYLLYFIAILSLSQAANLTRWAHAPVSFIGFWRMFLASLIIGVAFMQQKGWLEINKINKKQKILVFFSGFFLLIHFYTYFYAAQNTKIANCMIIFALNPLFIAGATIWLLKEKITWQLILAYILAAIGIFQLVAGNIQFKSTSWAGDLSAFISAIFFAGYIVTGRMLRPHMSNISYTFSIYMIATAGFALLALTQNSLSPSYPTTTWIAIAGLVLGPTLLGHFLFSYLMKHLNINFMSCGKLAEPILASFLALLIFHETIEPKAYAAFTCACLSIFILISDRNRTKV